MTEPKNALNLFRTAYEHRYTWDANFPGYRADIELKQGDEVYLGHIQIHPDLSVEVTGIADEDVKQSVYTQLRDIITHRKRNSFEQAHGKNKFSLGKTDDSGAIEILVEGDAMGSNYSVRGDEICRVSRVMGRMGFVINTHESLDTDQGYIASRYDVVFRNPQTQEIIRELEFEDTFEKFGNYYIMTRQVIHSKEADKLMTTEFNYSQVKLLEPVAV
ncbi:DUF3386 domain-containing protein [Planktothrix serta]|nr:DUF3386 domain-containing protein [Planktothrix serta]